MCSVKDLVVLLQSKIFEAGVAHPQLRFSDASKEQRRQFEVHCLPTARATKYLAAKMAVMSPGQHRKLYVTPVTRGALFV